MLYADLYIDDAAMNGSGLYRIVDEGYILTDDDEKYKRRHIKDDEQFEQERNPKDSQARASLQF